MTGQMSEIVAISIVNAVMDAGGTEKQVADFFRQTDFSGAEQKCLARFASAIIRKMGGRVRRKRKK